MRQQLLGTLLLLAACKDHVNQAVERNELADEVLATAEGFGKTMCACADATCAEQTKTRFDAWSERATAEIEALEKKQGETVTARKEAIEQAFDRYERCLIKFAIGRPPK